MNRKQIRWVLGVISTLSPVSTDGIEAREYAMPGSAVMDTAWPSGWTGFDPRKPRPTYPGASASSPQIAYI